MSPEQTRHVIDLLLSELGSSSSIRTYEDAIQRFLGEKDTWTAGSVRRYLQKRTDAGAGRSTVSLPLTVIKRFVRIAVMEGLLPMNMDTFEIATMTLREIYPPEKRPRRKEVAPITAKVKQDLLQIPDTRTLLGKRDYAIILLLLELGLTGAELGELRVSDFQRVALRIPGKRHRVLELSPEAIHAIKDWLNAACIKEGPLFRRMFKGNVMTDKPFHPKRMLWEQYSISTREIRQSLIQEMVNDGATASELMDFFGLRDMRALPTKAVR